MKPIRLLAPILAVTLGLTAAPAAQAFKVTMKHHPCTFYLGEVSVVTIRVQGTLERPVVKPPVLPDVLIYAVGDPARTPNVPGSQVGEAIEKLAGALADKLGDQKGVVAAPVELRRGDWTFIFKVQPEHSGEFFIPPFSVRADGEEALTDSMHLCVLPSGPAPGVRFESNLSNANPKPGEDLKLFLDVLVEKQHVLVHGKSYDHLPLRHINLLLLPEAQLGGLKFTTPLDKAVADHAVTPGHVGFHVKGIPYEVLFDQQREGDGIEPGWFRYRLALPVRFDKAGTYQLPAYHAIGEVYTPWPRTYVGTKKRADSTKAKWLPFHSGAAARTIQVRDVAAE